MTRIPYSEEQQRQQDIAKTIAESEATIMLILIQKGIVTPEEIERARLQAKHIIEQQFQAIKNEIESRWLKENPEMAAAIEVLNKAKGEDE